MSNGVGDAAGSPLGVQQVLARMAEIQARFQPPPAAGGDTAAAGGTSFADALAGAQGELDGTPAAGGGGDAVVADATRYLGVPYRWGGTDPARGLDCSGLVQRVYRDLGVALPRTSAEQARSGRPVASLADARPGDLVAFGEPVDHIGIYAGDGRMIVAPHTGTVVQWQTIAPRTPSAIRRVLPDAATAAAAAPGGQHVPYAGLFTAAGARHGVAPDLLAAVAEAESGFDPRAVSGAGARGLMQLMPGTAKSLGVDPMDPAAAVDGAARMLAGLERRFGSTALALAAYNAGPSAVARHHGIPPYAETQAYVRRVLALSESEDL
jgi:peptidoglycan DL-endopeptidase CwlO